MSYLTQHRTRIRKRYNYSKGALEAGMIVELTYKRRVKKGDPTKLITEKYMAIVLDASYNGYMHAMSLTDISSAQLNRLAVDWGLTLVERGSAKVTFGILTGEGIPKIEIESSATSAYRTQFSKLKGNLLKSYKTFNIKNIGNVAVVDYEWDKQAFNTLDILEVKKAELKLESEEEKKEKQKKAEAEAKKPTNK